MMPAKRPNYITPKGLEALRTEYDQLVRVERPKVVETVAWAAGNGDRSENGDYIYGKRRLREIDRRLRFLGKRMEAAQIIDPKSLSGSKVVFGATVTVRNEDDEELTYRIVGEDESDPKAKAISWSSPIAKALLGKSEGDEVLVKKPSSQEWLEILKVTFQ